MYTFSHSHIQTELEYPQGDQTETVHTTFLAVASSWRVSLGEHYFMHMANVLMWPQRISTLSDFYRKTIIASQALYGKVDPVNSKLDFLGGEGRGGSFKSMAVPGGKPIIS